MYNSQRFEEAAFEIYLQGMRDYKSICETVFMKKYDDMDDIQETLDVAQKVFEDTAGVKNNDIFKGPFSSGKMSVGDLRRLIKDVPDDFCLWCGDARGYVYSPKCVSIDDYYKEASLDEEV